MKTICQLVHTLDLGGAEVLAQRLATDKQLNQQYRFVFFCLDSSDVNTAGVMAKSLLQDGFAVECLNRQSGLDTACIKRLKLLLKQYSVDMIHAHQCTPFFYAAAARLFGKQTPILLTEHGRFFPDVVSWKRRLSNQLLLSKRDILTAVGQNVAEALNTKEGFPLDKIRVIFNGVNLDTFDNLHQINASDSRAAVRSELGIADDCFVLIQVARLDSIKDHLTALDMMEILRNNYTNIKLVIVGEGPERASIEQGITARHLSENVLLTGARQDVHRLLKAADTFLLTSLSEGIPVTFLEAMAARLPIVSTNAGGCREVVDHGITGYLEPVQDPVSLAEAVKLLLVNTSLRKRMGENARSRCELMFSEKSMHDQYAQLYQSILEK